MASLNSVLIRCCAVDNSSSTRQSTKLSGPLLVLSPLPPFLPLSRPSVAMVGLGRFLAGPVFRFSPVWFAFACHCPETAIVHPLILQPSHAPTRQCTPLAPCLPFYPSFLPVLDFPVPEPQLPLSLPMPNLAPCSCFFVVQSSCSYSYFPLRPPDFLYLPIYFASALTFFFASQYTQTGV